MKMKKILTSLLLAVLCTVITASAQVRQVTGSVKDESGVAVGFATVKIKGQTAAIVADEKGNFKVNAAATATLEISATGFATVEVKANATSLKVVLSRKVDDLEKVVVTAQGIRKKSKEIGYAYSRVSNEEITNGRAPQLTQALAGKVSGLAVYTVNNSVDPAVKVVLRGYRSLTGNNEALVVIDGMQTNLYRSCINQS